MEHHGPRLRGAGYPLAGGAWGVDARLPIEQLSYRSYSRPRPPRSSVSVRDYGRCAGSNRWQTRARACPADRGARDAITFQRDLHVHEEEDARRTIETTGGEIVELAPEEHRAFVSAVQPIYAEARGEYGRDLLELVEANHRFT